MSHQIVRDMNHLLENLNLNLATPIIFYFIIGFDKFGWSHVLFVACWSIWIYTLDDLIEERSLRGWFYWIPLIAISFILYPLITILVIIGEFLINLKAIFNKESFILEQFEGLGNYLIYVTPFLIPINVFDLRINLASLLYVMACNQAHKIGHRETKKPLHATIILIIIATFLYLTFREYNPIFADIWGIMGLISGLGFIFIKKRRYYNYVFQTIAGPLGFIYLCMYVI
ncbi:MAG: hypothetical protein QW618_01585 [Nitrososphaerales archaeon]